MPDTVLPVVDNYSPVPGTTIGNTDAVAFDVTDDSGLFCFILVTLFFSDTGKWEVVHTGVAFAPRYNAGSGRTVITNGFRYTVRRAGGWNLVPTVITYAIDAAGNESN